MTVETAHEAACAALAASHLSMIHTIHDAMAAQLEAMHDAMDMTASAGGEMGDDEPVRHVLSALLTVGHTYVQNRSATVSPAELALQFVLAVNEVAGDIARAYFDVGVSAEPLEPSERVQ